VDGKRTASQERAVKSTAKEICVTAGAGSGKTRVLVERFVHLVLDDGVRVDSILAITFTEKAASEMKERITREFERVEKEKERRQVEFAYISTIDSFCARLLRENALEARVDPRFRVLEELEADRLVREAADTVLLARPEEGLFELLEITGITDLSGALRPLYERIRHAGMPLTRETLEPSLGKDAGPEIVAEALRKLERVAKTERLTPRQEEMVRAQSRLLREIEGVPEEVPAPRFGEIFAEFRSRFDFVGMGSRPELKEALKRLEEGMERCLAERLERLAGPLRGLMADLLSSLDEEYARCKRALAVLDFADLEWQARELLTRSGEVRRRLQKRFRHLFLDEFQDTNPLQKGILDLLRGENRFFAAGDAKQSIYAFRDADVGIIAGFQKEAEADGGHIPLPENFRSRPELVSFSNRLFSSSLWRSGPVAFMAMLPAAEHDAKGDPSVEILRAEGENAEDARIREARALAERIAELVGSGRVTFTRKGSLRSGEPLTYGDVAVLFRSTTAMRLYERALANRHIPYFVQKGRGYFQTQEVRDLTNLLRILDNPRDDYHLAAVLRSPLCGLEDDDLYRLARGRQPGQRLADRLQNDADLSPEGRRRLAGFRALLGRIRRRKGRGPLWRELESVLSETPMALNALLHFNGRRRFANLRKLVELVRSWESREEPSIPALVELLEDHTGGETRESEAMVESPRDDTVKLMTIHAAKGLEFPLVVVADLGHGERRGAFKEIFLRGEGLGIAFYDPEEGKRSLKPASTLALEERQEEAQKQEENRLLYVAVTRAQEHLILSGWTAGSARNDASWMKSILEALGGEAAARSDPSMAFLKEDGMGSGAQRRISLAGVQQERLLRGEALAEVEVSGEEDALAEQLLSRAGLSSPPEETTPFLATATEIVQHHLCPRRYHLRYRIGAPSARFFRDFKGTGEVEGGHVSEAGPPDEELGDQAFLKDDELPAEVLGDRVHRILAEDEGSPLIKDLLATLAPTDRKEALRQVETFRNSALGRVARAGEAFREVPFAMSRFGATLRGQIDLVVRGAEGELTLVDYKTSRIAESEVSEKAADYELQLRIYALAARDLFGRMPASACLYFLHPNVIFDVDISPEALEAAERAIEAFFTAHRGADYPQKAARHCFACGYLTAYCGNLDRAALA